MGKKCLTIKLEIEYWAGEDEDTMEITAEREYAIDLMGVDDDLELPQKIASLFPHAEDVCISD